jgi:hypothetical protein
LGKFRMRMQTGAAVELRQMDPLIVYFAKLELSD